MVTPPLTLAEILVAFLLASSVIVILEYMDLKLHFRVRIYGFFILLRLFPTVSCFAENTNTFLDTSAWHKAERRRQQRGECKFPGYLPPNLPARLEPMLHAMHPR